MAAVVTDPDQMPQGGEDEELERATECDGCTGFLLESFSVFS